MPRRNNKVVVRHKKVNKVYATFTSYLLEPRTVNFEESEKLKAMANLKLMELSATDDCSSAAETSALMDENVKALLVDEERNSRQLRPAAQHAAARIVQLSRSVRHLTGELQVQRCLRKEAEEKLHALQQAQPSASSPSQPQLHTENDNSEQDTNQFKQLTSKLHAVNLRLFESRNQCQLLKQEIKSVQKTLLREVGDSSITNGTTNWRGRAEQILALKKKVSELEHQLKGQQPRRKASRADSRASLVVRQLEKERRDLQEQTSQQLQRVTAELEVTKCKAEAGRARMRILEAQLANSRESASALLEKDHSNSQIVARLTNQLRDAEKQLLGKQQEIESLEREWQAEKQTLVQDFIKEKSKTEELQSLLVAKNYSTEKMTEKIGSSSTNIELNEDVITEKQSSPPAIGTPGVPTCLQPQVTSSQQECRMLSVAAEAERKRLLELVAVLNQRLDEQRQQVMQAEDSLRKERYRSTKLEIKLEKLHLERVKTSKVNSYRTLKTSVEKDTIYEDLKNSLELAQEEVLVLKTKLQCLQCEKEEDLRIYREMLDQARNTYLEVTHCC